MKRKLNLFSAMKWIGVKLMCVFNMLKHSCYKQNTTTTGLGSGLAWVGWHCVIIRGVVEREGKRVYNKCCLHFI